MRLNYPQQHLLLLILTLLLTSPSLAMQTPSLLLPFTFEPLPLTSIKPHGWLRAQLQTLGDGLAGHEHDFYRFVRDSRWLGGDEDYSDLNEAMPYWFNGVVPLAYLLDDARLIEQIESVADHVLDAQQDDGWLGPETEVRYRNFWGRTPMVLGLVQMAEARKGTGLESRILDSLHAFVDLMHEMLADDLQGLVLKDGDEFDDMWGRARAAEMMLALQWLFEKHPRGKEKVLMECMRFFNQGSYDWSRWFSEEMYIKGNVDDVPAEITEAIYHFLHGVNAGQGLKAGAVIRRFTHDDGLLTSVHNGVNWTFEYHGTPSGGVIADERLSNLSPVRGVELCSVVETMYSLTYLYQTLGDNQFADRCELAAFNALPVMMTPDAWAHQYVAQTNQPVSHQLDEAPFYNVNTRGQMFGLEPNYPCCTVNHPQGYPKFVSNMFVRAGDDGIAHALLGPARVETTTRSGVSVDITCDTNYPFGNILYYTVEADRAFKLHLRVPSWATEESWYSVDGRRRGGSMPVNPKTGMLEVYLPRGKHVLVYSLASDIRVEPRVKDTVAIYRGPILYSIPIGTKVTSTESDYPDAPPSVREYTMTPTTRWGVAIDTSTLKVNTASANVSAIDHTLPDPLWEEDADLPTISATVCDIAWKLTGPQGYAPEPPSVGQRECTGEPYEVEMVPYGTARLHVAELPVADLG